MRYILIAASFCFTLAGRAQEGKDSLTGNNRKTGSSGIQKAVVQVAGKGRAAHITIPWHYRPDAPSGTQRVVVQDAKTGRKILHVKNGTGYPDSSEFWFEPVSGPGEYYIYYVPDQQTSSKGPAATYPAQAAEAQWFAGNKKTAAATLIALQPVDDFNSFYLLTEIMTGKERKGRLPAGKTTAAAPDMPLQIEGDSAISFPGRRITISKDGFPKQVQTFFNQEATGYKKEPNNLLYEPIHFHFTKQSDGKDVKLINGPIQFIKKSAGEAQWRCSSKADSLEMEVAASPEAGGLIRYTVKVTALNDIAFKDIVMHIPFQKDRAGYLMGLGRQAGLRPEKVAWKWDSAHNNIDAPWIGNVNAGLQYSLYDKGEAQPFNAGFYLQKAPVPSSWHNEGKGGIEIGIKGSSMLANNYSGPRSMKKGDTLYYNFTLYITPFHLVN